MKEREWRLLVKVIKQYQEARVYFDFSTKQSWIPSGRGAQKQDVSVSPEAIAESVLKEYKVRYSFSITSAQNKHKYLISDLLNELKLVVETQRSESLLACRFAKEFGVDLNADTVVAKKKSSPHKLKSIRRLFKREVAEIAPERVFQKTDEKDLFDALRDHAIKELRLS